MKTLDYQYLSTADMLVGSEIFFASDLSRLGVITGSWKRWSRKYK